MAGDLDGFTAFVLDQLRTLDTVVARPMFGGHGLYRGQTFFGIVHKGRLYFKTDVNSRETYRARGMSPFRPNARQTLKNYYEVPVDIIEDAETLSVWARAATSVEE